MAVSLAVAVAAQAAVLSLVVGPAFGVEQGSWTALGPAGGAVSALVVDPHTENQVFAGTTSGLVFRSVDGAGSWTRATTGLDSHRITDLAADPNTPGLLYAGTPTGLFKTTDGGASWAASGVVLTSRYIWEVAVDPNDASVVFVATDDGVWRSSDGGIHWSRASLGPLSGTVWTVVVDPRRPGTVYGGRRQGVYRSTDGGFNWQAVSIGLPPRAEVRSLAVDAAGALFAFARNPANDDRAAYRSTDGGDSWQRRSVGIPKELLGTLRLVADPAAAGVLYAAGDGVYKTEDSAETWQRLETQLTDRYLWEAVVDPFDSNRLYAGASSFVGDGSVGVLVSGDAGLTWEASVDGLWASSVHSLALTHAELASEVPPVDAIAAGTTDVGIQRSDDRGASWRPAKDGITEPFTGRVTQDPSDRSTLYTVAGDQPEAATQIYRSRDGGNGWARLGPELPCCLTAVAVDPVDSSRLYAWGGGVVHRSLDGGMTWLAVFDDFTNPPGTHLVDFGVDPSAPHILIAGGFRDSGAPVSPPIYVPELFRSTDGGSSWDLIPTPNGFVRSIDWSFAYDPERPGRLLAAISGSSRGAVLVSVDHGATWTSGPLGPHRFSSVLTHPRLGGRVIAGTADGEVVVSTDRGASFSVIDSGPDNELPKVPVRDLAFDVDLGNRLYAATEGAGVFALDLAFPPCATTATSLCLDQRFTVDVTWRDPNGNEGTGRASDLTVNSGGFWFFDPSNIELVIKVLDGRLINGHFWVFYGALSNVEYELTVTDTVTGRVATYSNPEGRLASVGDVRAFSDPATFDTPGTAPAPLASQSTVGESSATLRLSGERFEVEVAWRDGGGNDGEGAGFAVNDDNGYFWFFDPENVELAIKVLDGTGINGHFWVFYGALTNVGYTITITDTVTRRVQIYDNPPGSFRSHADTQAFQP